MRLTVIFEDRSIIKNGVACVLPVDQFPAHDANWHAIQWHDTYGTIEVKVGDRIWLKTDEQILPFVNAWVEPSSGQNNSVEEM